MTIYLEYRGYCVDLPQGETVVGRDVGCTLRFNDAAVSRRHLRVVRTGEAIAVEDLGSTNGTLLNGELVATRTPLRDRDAIEVGGHQLLVRFIDESAGARDTLRVTTFRNLTNMQRPPGKAVPETGQRCPRCTAVVKHGAKSCATCSYSWASGLTADTSPTGVKALDRRRHERRRADIRVTYRANGREVPASTRDLSSGGVFIRTAATDAPGTPCEITFLVDGAQPVTVSGVVRRVSPEQGGIAIELDTLTDAARLGLDAALSRSRTTTMQRIDLPGDDA